jgi:hypothetical protein
MIDRSLTRFAAVGIPALAAVALSGCKAPQAFGERQDLVIRADSVLWSQVEPAVLETMEARVFTTHPERTFEVTYVAPGDTLWQDFRLFWNVLVMGTPQDELVADLVDDSDNPDARPPAIVHVGDRWARGQLVTVLLLPEQGTGPAVRDILPDLFADLKDAYDDWVTRRMYSSGVNDSLGQVLSDAGFVLDVPKVYEFYREDSIFRFRNVLQQGDRELFRSLLVTWHDGVEAPPPDSLLAWRRQLGDRYYEPAQDVQQEGLRWDTVRVAGTDALELRGVFHDRTEFPAAGPFVTRAIPCPGEDRTYYLDAWLYAPGTDKYPYLRQLEILMGSFRCGAAGGAPVSGG